MKAQKKRPQQFLVQGEFSDELKRARRTLRRFSVIDFRNPIGDGRSWVALVTPTDVDLARQALAQAQIEVRVAAEGKSDADLLHEFCGVPLNWRERKIPSMREIEEEYDATHDGAQSMFGPPAALGKPTLEDFGGEAAKLVRQLIIGPIPASPDQEDLGKWAEELLPELQRVARRLRTGAARDDLKPEFSKVFQQVINPLYAALKQRFFEDAVCRRMTTPDLMAYMAEAKSVRAATLMDHRKRYRKKTGRARQRQTTTQVQKAEGGKSGLNDGSYLSSTHP